MKRLSLMLLGAVMLTSSCARETVVANDFWMRLSTLCGGTYQGKLVSQDAADALFETQPVSLKVENCTENEIRMPLAVGNDTTRTWILTRDGRSLTLRHDHKALPRRPEPVTGYGGVLGAGSTGNRVLFPTDEETQTLFDEEFLPEYKDSVWAIEIRPSKDLLAYEMSRPDRFFRLEFDTSVTDLLKAGHE